MRRTGTIDVDKLSVEAQLACLEAFDVIEEERREDTLSLLVEKAVLIEGKKRRGKTLSAVGIAWELRERFGRPVVCIGSNMGLNESFGSYKFMNEANFREEMERISVAATQEENAEQVMKAFEKYGISTMYATLIFDEARKMLNSRRAMDKLVQLVDDYLMQSSHYHTTTLICAPSEDELDKRILRQLDWKGRVYHNRYTNTARLRLVSGIDVITYDVCGAEDSEHIPFYDMYNSWAMLGFRKSSLKIKDL